MAFKFWILDKDEKIVAVASNRGAALPIFHFEEKEQLNGEYNVTFRVPANHEDAKYVVEGNYILVKDVDNQFQQFKITETRTTHAEENVIEVVADHVSYELYDHIIDKYEANNVPVSGMLSHILGGTRWDIGTIEIDKAASMTFYMKNALQCIHEIINELGGELRFRINFVGNRVIGRYVDVLSRRGSDTGKRFEYGKDITSIIRTVDDSTVATALIGLGKATDVQLANGENERLTFADVEWSTDNGDPVNKPKGQIWVGDEAARQNFGTPDGEGGRVHRMQVVEFSDIEDPTELLRKTYEVLPEYTQPRVTYDANVIDLETALGYPHEAVRLGDTVRAINRDFVPELRIKARVVEIQRDRLYPENSRVILGNFIDLFSDRDDIDAIKDRSRAWEGALKPGDPVKTSWLEGIIDALQNEIRAGGGKYRITDGGVLSLDKPPDQNPSKAVWQGGDIIAVSNTRIPGEDPASPAGWQFRNAITGDGIIADVITSGTLNASLVNVVSSSGDRTVRIADGNVYSYYQGNETMRFGSYLMELYDSRNHNRLGYFGVARRTGDVESRGMAWVGDQSFISINKDTHDGQLRSFFDADIDNNRLYLTGGWSGSQSGSATVSVYADEWPWGYGGGGYRATNQAAMRMNRDQNGSYVYIYYGDTYSNNSQSSFEVRENATDTTYRPMIRCQDSTVTIYSRTYLGESRTAWIEGTNDSIRLGVGPGVENYISVTKSGDIELVQGGFIAHAFDAKGTKIGGTIEIDGRRWGMSPIDSPQYLIEYIIFDQEATEDGTVVELDAKYVKAVENYAVFPNRGDVTIEDKTPTSFVVKGSGKVDLRIVGIRKGQLDDFWIDVENRNNKGFSLKSSSTPQPVVPPERGDDPEPERKIRKESKL